MRPNGSTILAAAIAAWLFPAAIASADITAFFGWSGGPSVRSGWGAAAGLSFVIVGLEFEYADAHESKTARRASGRET